MNEPRLAPSAPRDEGLPPAIVLVHGFTGSAESWGDGLVVALGRNGSRVVPVHVPGHAPDTADSESPECTLDGALDVIGAAEAGPLHLVGYSMGGRIALHFAARYPERVRSLVLESASPGLASAAERAARRARDEALAARIEERGLEAFVAEWERLPILQGATARDPQVRARERRIRLSHRPAGLAAALRGLGTGTLPSLWRRLEGVGVPTSLVVGAQDEKFVAIGRRMEAELPRARLAVVPEAGHTVHLDRPDLWLEEVRRHLAWAGAPSPRHAP